MNRVVFVDLETGGLDHNTHPIIQVAAVAFAVELWENECEWREVGSFERKVKFREEACDPEALKLRYRPEDWVDAVAPFRANDQLSQFLRDHATVERMSKAGKPYKVAQLAGRGHPAAGQFRERRRGLGREQRGDELGGHERNSFGIDGGACNLQVRVELQPRLQRRRTFEPRAARELQVGEIEQHVVRVARQGTVDGQMVEARAIVDDELAGIRLPGRRCDAPTTRRSPA